MTYQSFAKHIIQLTLVLIVILFAWTSYHQFMSVMPMESMADHQVAPLDCLTLCFTAAKVDISELMQSTYYSFKDATTVLLTLLAVSALAYLVLYYLRYSQPNIDRPIQRLLQYDQRQHPKYKLFSLWPMLYRQGIIASQLYS